MSDVQYSGLTLSWHYTQWLDGRHVVFGKVVEGMSIIDKLESVKTASNDRPREDVKVADSGVLELGESYNIEY